MTDVHHETVYFSGRVQGVGFRYTVMQVAKEFDVAGFVKNLPDGRVQLEAEGRLEEVNSFIRSVEDRMHSYVRNVERSGEERTQQFNNFVIK